MTTKTKSSISVRTICILALFVCIPFKSYAIPSTPETLDDAISQVKSVYEQDKTQPERARAEKAARAAIDIIRSRLWIFNKDKTTKVRQWVSVTYNPFYREKFKKFGKLRQSKEGRERAELAWEYKLGACEECATLMHILLTGAGVKNVKLLKSDCPHAFPVVNIAEDAHPDIPWTWGEDFWIPDAWNNKIFRTPEVVWKEGSIFDGGACYVDWYKSMIVPVRKELLSMVERDKEWIKQRCPRYKELYALYTLIPKGLRSLGIEDVSDTDEPKWEYITIPPKLEPSQVCGEEKECTGLKYNLVRVEVRETEDSRRTVNEEEYTFEMDDERVSFQMKKPPPPTICAGEPFTFEISGEATNVGLLYGVVAEWRSEDDKSLKGARFLKNGFNIGEVPESDEYIPSESKTLEAIPPEEYEGTEICLKILYGWGLGIESSYITWIDYIYKKQ